MPLLCHMINLCSGFVYIQIVARVLFGTVPMSDSDLSCFSDDVRRIHVEHGGAAGAAAELAAGSDSDLPGTPEVGVHRVEPDQLHEPTSPAQALSPQSSLADSDFNSDVDRALKASAGRDRLGEAAKRRVHASEALRRLGIPESDTEPGGDAATCERGWLHGWIGASGGDSAGRAAFSTACPGGTG